VHYECPLLCQMTGTFIPRYFLCIILSLFTLCQCVTWNERILYRYAICHMPQMSTRNLPGGEKGDCCGRPRTSLPSFTLLSKKCGNFKMSQPCGPPWPVAGIALPVPLLCMYCLHIFFLNPTT
jgi:hypothetical protein